MNSETGQIYRGESEIKAAVRRGEPLEPIGPRVAELDKHQGAEQKTPNGAYFDASGRTVSRRDRRRNARRYRSIQNLTM